MLEIDIYKLDKKIDMPEQEVKPERICLLKKEGMTIYLEKKEGKFTDVTDGEQSILPEHLINKRLERRDTSERNDISEEIRVCAQELKRKEYCKKLNYQVENLLFLTGAGSSYGIGDGDKKGRLMSELWDESVSVVGGEANMNIFCEKILYTDKDREGKYKKNLEKVLSLAEKAKDYVVEPIFHRGEGDNAKGWDIACVINEIKEMIKEKCNLKITSSESSVVHEKFLDKVTKRKGSLPRVKLFTLNYDTLFEQAARKGNYTVIDGFSFSLPRVFGGRCFDYDVVIRDGSRIKNEDNFVPRVFHLYKLHGSVDWEKSDGNIVQNRADDISVENSLMIFPQENKYEYSYEQPFFEMMTRFQAALRLKNTTLVVIGFSFGDKHILSMIKEALEQNPGFQLVVVNFRENGILEDDMFYKEAGEMGNLMLINETFSDFVSAYPDIKIYDQTDEYRLVKIAKDGNQ